MKIENHRLVGAIWCPSPNYNDRPSEEIDVLVVHNISLPPNEFGGHYIEQFFQNRLSVGDHPYFDEIKDLQVSAHLLIKRCGQVVQFVPFNKRAWHAGKSTFCGRENCNDFSIGIELEGADHIPYTQDQYEQLSKVTKLLQASYRAIELDNIVGHSDIAPERKTDPGPSFDWNHYKKLITS